MKKENKPMITATVIKGVEGDSLYINEHRVMGPKPWGGGPAIFERKVSAYDFFSHLVDALDDSYIELLNKVHKCKKNGHDFQNTGKTHTYTGNGHIYAIYECSCCGKQEERRIFDTPGEIKENSIYDNK